MRISDWSSDVCSSDLRAVAGRKDARPASSEAGEAAAGPLKRREPLCPAIGFPSGAQPMEIVHACQIRLATKGRRRRPVRHARRYAEEQAQGRVEIDGRIDEREGP